jgi:hypothetical protein
MLNIACKTSLVTMLRFSGAGAGEASAAPRRRKRIDVTFMMAAQREELFKRYFEFNYAIDIL